MTDLQQDFQDLEKAHDPQAGLRYLDAVGGLAAAREYKNRTFEMLELASGQTVLDVGCGTGDDARALAARVGPGGRVIGVDISEAAISDAIKRNAGATAHPEFRVGDVLQLDLPADEFDGVRADRVFLHVEDPRRALGELARVTRPGGKVVVFDPDWDTLVFDSPDKETTREIVQCNADRGTRNGWMGRQLWAMFLSAGLSQVEVASNVLILTSFQLANRFMLVTQLAEKAVAVNRLTAAQAARWLDQLQSADRAGAFFASVTGFIVAGRKPWDWTHVLDARHYSRLLDGSPTTTSEDLAMMFLAISNNTGNPVPYLEAEGARVAELEAAGLVERLLVKADRSGAVLLLHAPDLATAQAGLDSLPLVVNGITSFEVTEVTNADGTS